MKSLIAMFLLVFAFAACEPKATETVQPEVTVDSTVTETTSEPTVEETTVEETPVGTTK